MIYEIFLLSTVLSISPSLAGSQCQSTFYPDLFQRGSCGLTISEQHIRPKGSTLQITTGHDISDNNESASHGASKSTAEPSTSDLASFDEWKQKILSTENASDQVKAAAKPPSVAVSSVKKVNFASTDCGARIVASNPESTHASTILTESTDEYMNNPCSAPRKFFIAELCDSVSISEIEIGNLELFSSLPKLYNLSISDRYPTKEWFHIGKLHAKEERQIISFKMVDIVAANSPMKPLMYAKFVKVEILEHYGTEHYCPLTTMRVYGSGLLEDDDQDPDPDGDPGDAVDSSSNASENLGDVDSSKPPTNTLFNAAKKTVLQLFQHVLPPRHANNENNASFVTNSINVSSLKTGNSLGTLSTVDSCFSCIAQSKSSTRRSVSILCYYYELSLGKNSRQAPVREKMTTPVVIQKSEPNPTSTAEVVDSVTNQTAQAESVVAHEKVELSPTKHESKTPPCDSGSEQVNVTNASDEIHSKITATDNKPLENKVPSEEKVIIKPSISPEQVIVDSLMASVDGIAASEGDSIGGDSSDNSRSSTSGDRNGKSQFSSEGKPVGQLGGRVARRPTPSSTASSKQLLVRFVGRVRELELNLSLTNRYLEELSLNYRRRLDDLKSRVDLLSNLTAAQALEIERLTGLLNSTTHLYENALPLPGQSNVIYITVPLLAGVLVVLSCFIGVICACVFTRWRRPSISVSVSASHTNGALTTNRIGNGSLPSPSSFHTNGAPALTINRRRSSPYSVPEIDDDNSTALSEPPLSPESSNSLSSECSPRRHSATETPSPDDARIRPPNVDSGIADCLRLPATPLVVPANFSQSFLLSPTEKTHRRKRHHNHANGRHRQSLPLQNNAVN